MRPHEASPSLNTHPAPPPVPEGPTSPGYMALWFLVAIPVVFFGYVTFVFVILTAAITTVPTWAGNATIVALLLIALAGVPLSLVFSRQRSIARTVLLRVLVVSVLVYFGAGWALIEAGSHYGVAQ